MYRFYKILIKLLIIDYFIENDNNNINDNKFLTSNVSIFAEKSGNETFSFRVGCSLHGRFVRTRR